MSWQPDQKQPTVGLGDLFAQAPMGLAVLGGADHVIEAANPEYRKMVGDRDLIGSPLKTAIPEAEAQGYVEILDLVRSTGEARRDTEAPVRWRAGGEESFFDFVYQPIVDEAGKVDRILVVAVDVTDRVLGRRRAERSLAVLAHQKEVLEDIVAGRPLEEVLESLLRSIEATAGNGVLGSILLLDDDGIHLRHCAAPRLPAAYVEAIDGVAIGPAVGSCGTAAYRGEQVIVADIARDPLWEDFRQVAAAAGLAACWSTPIVDGAGQVLGTFAMYYPDPREPSEDDLRLIDLCVRTAAVAIGRSRADQQRQDALNDERRARSELERAHSQLNLMLEVTTHLAASFERDDTLATLAHMAVPALGDICLIDLAEHDGVRRAAVAGAPSVDTAVTAGLKTLVPRLSEAHPIARVLRSGRSEHAAEILDGHLRSTFGDGARYRMAKRLGLESYISVPLAARGRVFGVLTVVSTCPGRRYGERDVAVAEDLARRAALVIDNINVYKTVRDAERRLSLVARAGVALTSSLDVNTVVTRMGHLLVPEVGDACEVYVKRPDRQWWRRSFAPSAQHQSVWAGFVQAEPLPPEVDRALAERTPRTVSGDLSSVFSSPPGSDGEAGSAVVVPLIARGDTIGAIVLAARGQDTGPLDPFEAVEVLSGRAALALDNAILYEHQRSAAEILQRSLMPQCLPSVPGLELAARYRPAGPEVGGDWYDVLRYPDGRVGLVMGDVMGRGVPAASVMGQLRNALRILALQNTDPAAALAWLNRMLGTEEESILATIVFGVLDPRTLTLDAANAGHCPPLTVSGGVSAYLRQEPDPPLAVAPGTTYHEFRVQLRPGDLLIMYTDGLIEHPHRSLERGLSALAEAVAGAPSLAPEAVCDHLFATLGDGESDDDTALIAVGLQQPD